MMTWLSDKRNTLCSGYPLRPIHIEQFIHVARNLVTPIPDFFRFEAFDPAGTMHLPPQSNPPGLNIPTWRPSSRSHRTRGTGIFSRQTDGPQFATSGIF